jgi:hypothetical protein
MKNINLILAVLLCVQLVVFLVRPSRTVGRSAQTVELYAGLDAAAVASVEISSGTEKVTLIRKDKEWVIPQSHGYLADTSRVEEIMALLPQLARAEVVSTKPDMFASYDLADNSSFTRLRLLDKAGQPLADLMVGKSLVRSSFVRRTGEQKIYRVDAALSGKLMTRPRDFFSDTRLPLPESAARTSVVVEHGGDTMEFRKVGGGEPAPPQFDHMGNPVPIVTPDRWELTAPEGATVDATAVEQFVTGLGNVYFEDVVAAAPTAAHQLQNPFVRLRFRTEKEEVQLVIGAPVDPEKPEGPRAMQIVGRPWVYGIDSFSWKRWAKRASDFFTGLPEGPAADGSGLPTDGSGLPSAGSGLPSAGSGLPSAGITPPPPLDLKVPGLPGASGGPVPVPAPVPPPNP